MISVNCFRVGAAAVALTSALAGDSRAQDRCYPVQTYYSMPSAAYAASPSACHYVYRQVPTTSYEHAVSVDPWTGQQVVTMRPITTMQWQLQADPFSACQPLYGELQGGTPIFQSSPNTCAAPNPYRMSPDSVSKSDFSLLQQQFITLERGVQDLWRQGERFTTQQEFTKLQRDVVDLRRRLDNSK